MIQQARFEESARATRCLLLLNKRRLTIVGFYVTILSMMLLLLVFVLVRDAVVLVIRIGFHGFLSCLYASNAIFAVL